MTGKHDGDWVPDLRAALVLCLLCLLPPVGACADVVLPALIGDGMVLQRGIPVRIWGAADPGEQVGVDLDGEHGVATANSGGSWRVSLPAMQAGGPFELTITGSNRIAVHDVMVGEVWLCAGQSNMRLPVELCSDSSQEIAGATHPNMRLFTVNDPTASVPPEEVVDRWLPCSPETVGPFSGAAYFFGRYLEEALGVPIGLIESAVDSSCVEEWTSLSALRSDPDVGHTMGDWPADTRPGELFEAMVRPLTPYRIRGVIWYQGEANVRRAFQYRRLFPILINDWRSRWGQGDFPFLYVQLSTYLARDSVPSESYWAEMREAQLMALSVPNTEQAVAIDIGDGTRLHPRNKQDVGKRLGMAALGSVYGGPTAVSGPLYQSMRIEGNTATICFTHTDGGLLAGDGGPLRGFAIAGADRRFCWADAVVTGGAVRVSSEGVPKPVAVRYAWANNPDCNLYNGALLPASPFRTDDWPLLTTSGYQPSGVIYNGSTYIGSGVYNTTGLDQTHTQSVHTNAAATYHVRFYNGGSRSDSFRITGPGGSARWRVSYYDHETGEDISASVAGTGWVTPSLAVDAYRRIRIEVTPLLGAAPDASQSTLVTATSLADGTRQDAVKAVTTCQLTRRPDGMIHDGTAYIGDGLINTTGAGQTHSRTTGRGRAAAYLMRFSNDGNASDRIKITGPGGNSAWGVKYTDYSTGTDITNAVKGVGWTTPSLAAGGYRAVRLEVTPLAGAAGNSTRPILLTGTSSGDATKRDVVKSITTCAPDYQPDGLIYNGAAYIGDGIYNTTGSGQTHALTARLGATATYHVYLYNDGNVPQQVSVTGTVGGSKWTVRYFDYATGTDITTAVTTAGWLTPVLNPRAARRLKVLVTPGASVPVGGALNVLLTGKSTVDGRKSDTVKATATRS